MSIARTLRRLDWLALLRAPAPAAMLGASLLLGGIALVSPPNAQAQSQSLATAQRIIQGKVIADDAPVKGAVVYLKNAKSLEVRTYISTADGSYRFGQLSGDSDYTLWADYQGKKSKERTVSSFDSKRLFDFDLKIK